MGRQSTQHEYVNQRPWNIFLPYEVVREQTCLLAGTVCHKNLTVCVHGMVLQEKSSKSSAIVGVWHNQKQHERHTASSMKDSNFWLYVGGDEHGSIAYCSLKIKSATDNPELPSVVCILYKPKDVWASYILQSFDMVETGNFKHFFFECHEKLKPNSGMDKANLARKTEGIQHSIVSQGHMSEHVLSILACQSGMLDAESDVKSFYPPLASKLQRFYDMIVKLVLTLPFLLVQLTGNIGLLCEAWMKYSSIYCSSLPKLLHTPSIICHLKHQARRYKMLLSMEKENNFTSFVLFNCCAQQLADTLLGICLILLITSYGLTDQIALYILDWADGVAQELTSLVQWLMGAPAGLKLNAQLTEFLGHFFIYHIYLWTGYVTLLRGVMPLLIWLCSITGVLGVTAQLCLMQDILSMLTIHIYCFYVYAAKIFYLQIYALRSLWRLFRGKKWNVLRSRVDSASYNTDQLFVGTLLFTILLFLLPTTALYYAVFTLIRLLVLIVQGLLSRVVAIIKSMPVFTIIARLAAPKLVAGSAVFRIFGVPDGQTCLILTMQTCQLPFSQLVELTAPVMTYKAASVYTWGQFLSHLLTGKLIYPWVEARSSILHEKTD